MRKNKGNQKMKNLNLFQRVKIPLAINIVLSVDDITVCENRSET